MSTLTKLAKARSHSRVFMVALKPADALPRTEDEDCEEFDFYARYVDKASVERKIPCTGDLFNKITGRIRNKASHTGLDIKTEVSFVLHVQAGGERKAAFIDQYPVRKVLHNIMPADHAERIYVEMEIDPNGQMTVTSTPYKMRENKLLNLMGEIDKLEQLETDQQITPDFRIYDIQGRRVRIEFTGEQVSEEPVHRSFRY